MITEFAIATAGVALYRNVDKIKIHKKWNGITKSQSKFTNKLEKTLKIWHIDRTPYGYDIVLELPYGYTFADLEGDIDVFREGLQVKTIHLTQCSSGNIIVMNCVSQYEFKDFNTMQLPSNKIVICDGLIKPIIVDLNKFPHVLIGGDTGTGKTRVLLAILSNLIYNYHYIDIHLLQIRKNDLGVFKNCVQVKTYSRTLGEVLEALESIDKECRRREILIDNTKGYYSIADYNKDTNNKALNYIYVVIEEFSFLNISRGDSKEEKALKSKCLRHLKTIVNVGRSSGVFLITALQKPTADSIPTDIKAQLCTRVSLKIADGSTAKVITDNENPTKLGDREVIVRTLGEEKGYSYTIDHSIVTAAICKSIVEKKKIEKPKEEFVESDLSKLLELLNETNG